MIINKSTFFHVIEKFEYVPFEQTLAWENYKNVNPKDLIHFVDNQSDPYICCWGRVITKPVIGRILDIQGEVKKANITSKQIQHFWEDVIKDASCNMIVYNSISAYTCDYDISMRRAGFNRPLGNRVCPLTIFVNIQEERNFDRNWRRNLKKSISEDLKFEVVENPNFEDAQNISKMFDELRKMKGLKYQLDPKCLRSLFDDRNFHLFYALKNGNPICARIVYIQKKFAADVYAANSFESRAYSATHLLMEKIFEFLKTKGVEVFDFSRIPPSNNETDSVYVFKKSAGGYPVQYNGEWIWCKRKVYSLLFCIYNFFIQKSHQY